MQTCLVRHDADPRRVFVYEHVVRLPVRAIGEDGRFSVGRYLEGLEPRDYGIRQPCGQWSIQKRVLDKITGPCLQASMRELLPSWFGRRCYLHVCEFGKPYVFSISDGSRGKRV